MILAVVPFLALQLDRVVRAALRGLGGAWLLVALLLLAAGVQVSIEGARQQPVIESVDGLRDGVSRNARWVRMRGEIVTLSPPESVAAGNQVQSLLVEGSGDAIVLLSQAPVDQFQEVTGRIGNSNRMGEVARGIGGDRFPAGEVEVIDRFVLRVDEPPGPPDDRDWTLAWIPLLAAGLIVGGRWTGYPVIRTRPVDEVPPAPPLAVDETLRLRVVEREDETGLRLRGSPAVIRRLPRREADDPYFSLEVEGLPRPLAFRRHTWSTTAAGTIWSVLDRVPAVELRDWGIEVLLALDSAEDRDRLVASFLRDEADEAATERGAD